MRVGMNVAFLQRHTTGTGQYTAHLLRALADLAPHVQIVPCSPGRGSGGGSNWGKLWFEQVVFPRTCRAARVDVAHVPYFAPPLSASTPTVVTIHDLIPLLLPAYRGSVWVQAYMRLVSTAARRASWIITDSQCSKQDIVQHLRLDPDRVRVIYLAADPSCRTIRDPRVLASLRQMYGLPQEYILYLGGFDQRKNLRGLLHAYARLKERLGAQSPALVIAGSLPEQDSEFTPDPRRITKELGLGREVMFAGPISEEDKPALYSGALLFAFLSLYEGFGLMALEAMSCGVPVVVSDRSSLPEVVGSGGLLVDPQNPDQIADSIARILVEPNLRADLAEQARLHASRFDWRRTAEQTLEVYRAARERSFG